MTSFKTAPDGPSFATHLSKLYKAAKSNICEILVGQLFDPVSRGLLSNQVITVDRDTGLILAVQPQGEARVRVSNVEPTKIDLSHLTVLPGFVDTHVHLFLRPYSEASWEDQLTKESLPERTLRASVHARKTLQAGFTTVRDLGTEGALDADIALRKAISGKTPLLPGPRYYCANRAIISTGSYGPKSNVHPSQEGVDGITGASVVDGQDACVREVRRQIGTGADWIKIYGDYGCRSRLQDVSPTLARRSTPTFNKGELEAMVSAAHARGVKVAAHANTADAARDLLEAGVDSLEHGAEIYDESTRDRSVLRKLYQCNSSTTWIPTLSAYYIASLDGTDAAKERWTRCQITFQEAVRLGLENIACGGDTGVFAHGQNALELVLMRRLGASWDRVLSWATYRGWLCVRGSEWEGDWGERYLASLLKDDQPTVELDRGVPFGLLRAGWAADLIGISGKLDGTEQEFEDAVMNGVQFVMKGGVIFKENGLELHPV